MRKNFLYSTVTLIVISSLSKILSFIVRIFLARHLSESAMNLYSVALPTLVFLIALAQMGIPSALSKYIAQNQNPMNGILSSLILSLVSNVVLIVLFVLMIPFLSNQLFHDDLVKEILKSMIFMIPMVTFSGLLKAILQGKQHHIIACFSQIFEELFRLVYLIILFSQPIISSIELARIAMFSVFVGECGSSLFMLIFILFYKKPIRSYQHDLRKEHFKEILSSSIPMTSARLLGSFTYFMEPLVFFSLSNSLLFQNAYGNFNGYVLPLLTMPSFVSVTLANMLLPTFVYEKKHNNLSRAKKIFYLISLICFTISFCCAFVTFFFPKEILQFFYHTTRGSEQLQLTSIPFVFYSLQPVLSSLLHALDQSRKAFIDTALGCAIRLLILPISVPLLGHHALIFAITLSMFITTGMHALRVIKSLQVLTNSSV